MNISRANRFLSFFLILLLFSVAFTQEVSEESSPEIAQTQTVKVDELGRLGECAFGARMDNLAIELQNKPDAVGYIIAYKSVGILPSQIESPRLLIRARNYLVNTRGMDPLRLVVIDGGFREKEATELWLVPPGGAPPTPSDTVPAPIIPKGKTYLYDKVSFEDPSEFALPVAEEPNEEPEDISDSQEFVAENIDEVEEVDETEPVEEEAVEEIPELSPEELEAIKFSWLDERFAELVKTEKKSRGVIIFYADETTNDINKIRSHIEEGRERLLKNSGLAAERFEIVFGGYRSYPEIDFWFVPPGGEAPVPTPETKETEEEIENSAQTEN